MKYKYSINNDNQLIIKRRGMKKSLLIDGKFDVDKNNRLIYWLNEPDHWRRIYNLSHKIKFEGNWKLNPNYDLELILNETRNQFENDRLVLKGEIISVARDTLVFEIESMDKRGLNYIQIVKLNGFWQADTYNRLSFAVKKKPSPDIFTLETVWQINQNQQIIYNYERTNLKRKTKYLRTLTFEGYWQISSATRISYILAHSPKSQFDFRVQIETPNLYPKEGVIKYRLGIGLKGLIPKKGAVPIKIISLYGVWKFSRKFGLSFLMDYGQDKIQAIEFGANIYLPRKNAIIFSLTNKRKEPLGMQITFTHRFLKRFDAEVFLRLKRFQQESGIETGIRVPF